MSNKINITLTARRISFIDICRINYNEYEEEDIFNQH